MLARVVVARLSFALVLRTASALSGQTTAMLPAAASDLPHEAAAALNIAKPSRGAVRVDGYLSESVWSQATTVTNFVQSAPRAGAAVSEKTEVSVLTTEPGLLIGARFYDSDVSRIVAASAAGSARTDAIELSFDMTHNHRDVLVLSVTAGGARSAVLVQNGVRRELPDLKWLSTARQSSQGWSVEILLPYDALGDDVQPAPTWGWQVRRFIARKNEWSSYPAVQSEPANPHDYAHLLVLGGKPKR